MTAAIQPTLNRLANDWLLHPATLSVVVVIGFFVNLWGIPLFDLDEGAFSEATREMLHSGNFAATYLDGAPRYDKPILSYWFQALSVHFLGINEFAFRLPSAIAAVAWVGATYSFTKAHFDERSARYVVLIMATTLWVTMIGRAATADAWLNLFIALSVFDIWRYFVKPDRNVLARVYVWLALGLLTKGPVAVLIPLLTSGIVFTLEGQIKRWLQAVFNPLGWLILLAIISPWLWLVYQDQGMGFFKGFLLDHNLNRFNATKEGHGGQLWYYLWVLPLILLPYTGTLFALMKQTPRLARQSLPRYLLVWFAVVFTLVSVSQTQLPHYVLYGVTGLLILFAVHRHTVLDKPWVLAFPVILFALFMCLPWIMPGVAASTHAGYEKTMLSEVSQVFDWHYLSVSALAFMCVLIVTFWRSWPVVKRMLVVGVVQSLFVYCVFTVAVAQLQQAPVKEAAAIARTYPPETVIAYGIRMPSFSVYRGHETPSRAPQTGDLIFTRIDRLDALHAELPHAQLNAVYTRGAIALIEVRAYTDAP